MNGYDLSRNWFNFRFENPSKCRSVHTELYLYIVDLWNRLGQKKEFGLPTSNTIEMLGISYNTYKKTLDELIAFGFVILVKDSKNQHHSKIVALSNIDKATDKALDKATVKAIDKATDKATDTIDKQRTIEQRTIEQIKKEQSLARFQKFWDLYDKKHDLPKCKDKFCKLSEQEQNRILEVVCMYVAKTPDKQFRKNPLTWLNGKCWLDDYSDVQVKTINPKPERKQFFLTTEYEQAVAEWEAKNKPSGLHDIQGHLL